jgi:multicomponent Na+:H+ antiporter subunit F
MIWVVAVCLTTLTAAAALCVVRLLRAESIADRVIALDLLLGVVVTGIGVGAVATRTATLLNLLIVTALLGFVATVTVARFIEQRGV